MWRSVGVIPSGSRLERPKPTFEPALRIATGFPVSCFHIGISAPTGEPRNREQPKISEEGIWSSPVIAKAVILIRTMKLSAQDRSQMAANEAVGGREGESMGMPEIAEPTSQERIEQRYYAFDQVTLLRLVWARILSRSPIRHSWRPPSLSLEPVAQKLGMKSSR